MSWLKHAAEQWLWVLDWNATYRITRATMATSGTVSNPAVSM
jgi:hypothetical protein